MVRVLVSMPSMGNPSFKTLQSLVRYASSEKNHQPVFHFPEGSVLHRARNMAVVAAINQNCDYLMFIDDDMTFLPDSIDTLISRDKDIIGGLCFQRKEPLTPVAKHRENNRIYNYTFNEIKDFDKPFEVYATGTGFLLIKAEVLKQLNPPHFYFAKHKDFMLEALPYPEDDMSEDTSFMIKAQTAGFEVWVDPTVFVGHVGDKVYSRPIADSVDIFIPTMGRFDHLEGLIKNIEDATPQPHTTYFISDEPEAQKIVENSPAKFIKSDKNTISYAKRINYLFSTTTSRYFFTGSNDIHFTENWLVKAMEKSCGYGVIAVNDLFNPEGTNFLIDRKYIEKYGGTFDGDNKVFHEYIHNFCDTELITKARFLGQYLKADDSIVEHNHHLNKKAELDWVYQKGLNSFNQDKEEYVKRVKEFAAKNGA